MKIEVEIRPAKIADIADIHRLIRHYAREKRLLPRTNAQIKKGLRSFMVAVCNSTQEIVGCIALEVYSAKLAEVRSLAVDSRWQSMKIGTALVQACLLRAKKRKILEVMAITSSEGFFNTQGFSFALPHEKKALFYYTR